MSWPFDLMKTEAIRNHCNAAEVCFTKKHLFLGLPLSDVKNNFICEKQENKIQVLKSVNVFLRHFSVHNSLRMGAWLEVISDIHTICTNPEVNLVGRMGLAKTLEVN